MQTFLPYADFAASAAVLDDRRLGKQRVEAYQILRALTWPRYGWKNHPAVRMWRGFTPALVRYGLDVCDSWEARGYADATRAALLAFTGGRVPQTAALRAAGQLPPWLGHEPVHLSHRSALLRKLPEHYRPFFGDLPDELPYCWPPAAFPRWPLRRGRLDPLPLATALALLGHTEPRPEQAAAVAAVQDGEDAEVVLPPGGGATSTGLLAGLCTRGSTLWVSPDPPPAPRLPPPPPPGRREGYTGRVSVPVAKPPTAEDLAAMATEAEAEPEFHFSRPSQLGVLDAAVTAGVGLVVLDGVDRASVPDLGVPVLTLRTVPASASAEAG